MFKRKKREKIEVPEDKTMELQENPSEEISVNAETDDAVETETTEALEAQNKEVESDKIDKESMCEVSNMCEVSEESEISSEERKPAADEETAQESDTTDVKDSIHAYCIEAGYGEEMSEKLKEEYSRIEKEIKSGAMSGESIELLMRGINYASDLEKAMVEGEIRGRNATIKETLMMTEDSDGIPHPGSGQAGISGKHRAANIFDLARGAF